MVPPGVVEVAEEVVVEVEVVEVDVVDVEDVGVGAGAMVDGRGDGAIEGTVEPGPVAVVLVSGGGSGTVGLLAGERAVPPPPMTFPMEVPPE